MPWTSLVEWRILSAVNADEHLVFIVDDDRHVCEALAELLQTFDLRVLAFGSAHRIPRVPKPDVPACSCSMCTCPTSTASVQSQTACGARKSCSSPGTAISPRPDTAIEVVSFLTKPLRAQLDFRAIQRRSRRIAAARLRQRPRWILRQRQACLTPHNATSCRWSSPRPPQQAGGSQLISEVALQIITAGSCGWRLTLANLVRMAGKLETHHDEPG